jgi:hypothetical protein
MADPTASDVRTVIMTGLSDSDLDSVISIASNLYTNYLGSSSIDAATELNIKIWLSAHFVSLKDAQTRVEEEKIGDVSAKYSSIDGNANNGLLMTRWGKTATTFDPTGILKGLGTLSPRLYSL